jgi:hypothetical protein
MGLFGAVFNAMTSNDGGCDWICDTCGAYMNSQPGFSVSSGSWCCKECGSWNDVSEDNVIDEDDGYVGSYQYYEDEERRNREEEENLRELGIDPDDD